MSRIATSSRRAQLMRRLYPAISSFLSKLARQHGERFTGRRNYSERPRRPIGPDQRQMATPTSEEFLEPTAKTACTRQRQKLRTDQ